MEIRRLIMRKARIIKRKVYYHVSAMANRKEFIFNNVEIKKLYQDILKEARKKFNFTLKNYCIMDNHIHLLIKPWVGESLSIIMKWIQQVFAGRFNKLNGYVGRVWRERFYSSILETKKRIAKVFLYIVDNPIRAKLIDKPDEYKYGGLYWIKKRIYDLVDPPGFLESIVKF